MAKVVILSGAGLSAESGINTFTPIKVSLFDLSETIPRIEFCPKVGTVNNKLIRYRANSFISLYY